MVCPRWAGRCVARYGRYGPVLTRRDIQMHLINEEVSDHNLERRTSCVWFTRLGPSCVVLAVKSSLTIAMMGVQPASVLANRKAKTLTFRVL